MRALTAALSLLLVHILAGAEIPPSQTLFPTPFVVEHHITQTQPGDAPWETDPVTTYYTGSWVVSVRPDGGRTVVDLSRREITEVQAEKGTYWTLSFGRMAELRQRLARAEEPPEAAARRAQRASTGRASPRVKVEEVRGRTALAGTAGLAAAPGVRHLRATVEGGGAELEAWFDGRVRLTRDARAALSAFERESLGDSDAGAAGPPSSELMAAARDAADGAVAVRTRRNAGRGAGTVIEEIVTRLEPIAAVPPKLLTIPESFKRVPSPLEAMVSFAEEEAARRSTPPSSTP